MNYIINDNDLYFIECYELYKNKLKNISPCNQNFYNFNNIISSNEEKIIKNKIDEIIKYCECVIDEKYYDILFNSDKELMKYHINYLRDILLNYTNIYESIIKYEINKEYNLYKILLNGISIDNMIYEYIKNDNYINNIKNTLFNLYYIIDENVNDI